MESVKTNTETALKRLVSLAQEALRIRDNTKGALDGKFLESIFHDKKWRKIDLRYKLEMLAKIYSVARTVDLDKMVDVVASGYINSEALIFNKSEDTLKTLVNGVQIQTWLSNKFTLEYWEDKDNYKGMSV